MKNTDTQTEAFFQEYTSQGAILKYTRATAGFGIGHLLDHDYKEVYMDAIKRLPQAVKNSGIRILEFGCGGGMNLVHLISVLNRKGIHVERAVGTDFSPVLIDAAKRDAKHYLRNSDLRSLEFHVARNESLIADLSTSPDIAQPRLENCFDLILGVNTIRYCHAAKQELECARDIFQLLTPGGICVVIDMNNRYPFFRSDLKKRLLRTKENECYVPTLEEYAAPFVKTGFELLRKEHFCWVPHSASAFVSRVFSVLTSMLNAIAKSRAMRSLVVARKPL
jgi:SAM-dependent methyltransferase